MHLAPQIAQRIGRRSGLHHEDLRGVGWGHTDVVDAAGPDLDQGRGLVAQAVGGLPADLQLGNARADQRLGKAAGQQRGVKAPVDQDVGGHGLGRRKLGPVQRSQKHQQGGVLGGAQAGAVGSLRKSVPAGRVRLRQGVQAGRCQHRQDSGGAQTRADHGESGKFDHGADFLAPRADGPGVAGEI
jgi:hypothetical protein